jgi:ABC-2 type transport system permease protein
MRLLEAELLKIWTAPRTLLGILLAELAIVLIGTISTLYSATNGDPVLPPRLGRDIATMGQIALLFTTLIGVLIATTEYRHGTITLTFLAAPVREKVIAAKTGAAVIASALLVLPAVLLPVVIAAVWVGGRDDYHFGGHEYGLIGRLFLCAALVAVIGLFIGASLKRQLGAVILVLGWLFFFEPALAALVDGAKDYLAGPAIGGVLGDSGNDAPSFGHALGVLAAYLASLGAVAVVLTRRRDVT